MANEENLSGQCLEPAPQGSRKPQNARPIFSTTDNSPTGPAFLRSGPENCSFAAHKGTLLHSLQALFYIRHFILFPLQSFQVNIIGPVIQMKTWRLGEVHKT